MEIKNNFTGSKVIEYFINYYSYMIGEEYSTVKYTHYSISFTLRLE
jgi:hypothetical protein